MTTAVGRGVRLEIALTFAAAKTATAISQASPGVATSPAHSLANGTVGYWSSPTGMVQLDGQATRVYNQATNTFELQGLNTSSFSAFGGTPTFTPVATWGTLAEAIGYQLGGGTQDRLDDSKLLDVVQQDVFGLLPADTMQIDILSQTYNSAIMQAIEDAAIAGTYLVGRITLLDGSVRVWRGSPSRPGESLQRKQLATGSFQFAVKGLVLRGQA